jgi:hypothetical protein
MTKMKRGDNLHTVTRRRRADSKIGKGEEREALNHELLRSQRVIEFPTPPEVVVSDTIIFEIGGDRFTMSWRTERLPPAGPVAIERK